MRVKMSKGESDFLDELDDEIFEDDEEIEED
jgi:hypothetical protein